MSIKIYLSLTIVIAHTRSAIPLLSNQILLNSSQISRSRLLSNSSITSTVLNIVTVRNPFSRLVSAYNDKVTVEDCIYKAKQGKKEQCLG